MTDCCQLSPVTVSPEERTRKVSICAFVTARFGSNVMSVMLPVESFLKKQRKNTKIKQQRR